MSSLHVSFYPYTAQFLSTRHKLFGKSELIESATAMAPIVVQTRSYLHPLRHGLVDGAQVETRTTTALSYLYPLRHGLVDGAQVETRTTAALSYLHPLRHGLVDGAQVETTTARAAENLFRSVISKQRTWGRIIVRCARISFAVSKQRTCGRIIVRVSLLSQCQNNAPVGGSFSHESCRIQGGREGRGEGWEGGREGDGGEVGGGSVISKQRTWGRIIVSLTPPRPRPWGTTSAPALHPAGKVLTQGKDFSRRVESGREEGGVRTRGGWSPDARGVESGREGGGVRTRVVGHHKRARTPPGGKNPYPG